MKTSKLCRNLQVNLQDALKKKSNSTPVSIGGYKMYSNLIAEMKAKKVSRSDIQKLLQIHSNSVSNKLKHRTSFTIDEAMKI